MEQEILASIYPLVKEFEDAPLSLDIIKNGVRAEEYEVLPVFEYMIKNGLLEKKYDQTTIVYKLTPKGMDEVLKAYSQKQNQADSLISQ